MNTAIVYDHRGRVKTGEGPLEVRIIVDRKPYYIGTGVRVMKSEWKNGEVVNREDSVILNERIQAVRRRVEEELTEWLKSGKPFSAKEIKKRVHSPSGRTMPTETDMYDWICEQYDMLPLEAGTLKHYRTLILRLREFGRMMSWRDLTVENIYMFDAWLCAMKKTQTDADRKAGREANIGRASVYNYHKCLKAMANRAVKFGIIDANPYDRLRGAFHRGEKDTVEFLTEDEMKAIEALRPLEGSQMAVVRDLFTFQMYTGMSYADTQSFDIGDYDKVDGHWVSVRKRTKTGSAYVSQLLPPVVDVLERYGMKVPAMPIQKYNSLLKYLGEVAGIRKRLTSHVARHTFATWALHNKVELHVVSAMLGHSSTMMTQRYAKTLGIDVRAGFDSLEKLMK